MSNENLPKSSTIVISFVGPEGKQKWIGSWKCFKSTHPRAKVKDVETLHNYTKRLKPLNDKEAERIKEELTSTPGTAINH